MLFGREMRNRKANRQMIKTVFVIFLASVLVATLVAIVGAVVAVCCLSERTDYDSGKDGRIVREVQ